MGYILPKEEIEYILNLSDEEIKQDYNYVSPHGETTKQEQPSSQITKCVQVLKYIVSELTELSIKTDLYKVLKMLYFADRIHLLEYGDLIAPDKYLKMEHGPVPSLCYSIIQFVRGDKCASTFVGSIKEEFEVLEDEKSGKRNKLHNLTKPDYDYLSNSNIDCLSAAIKKYGNYGFDKLKLLSHDEIYHSVDDYNDEITISDMLNVLNNDKEFAERCLAGFNH